ncbi:hypothetical protein [Actinoplanes sp. NPDC049118]
MPARICHAAAGTPQKEGFDYRLCLDVPRETGGGEKAGRQEQDDCQSE